MCCIFAYIKSCIIFWELFVLFDVLIIFIFLITHLFYHFYF